MTLRLRRNQVVDLHQQEIEASFKEEHFFKKVQVILLKIYFSFRIISYSLVIANYNPGHNSLRHFDVWQNFRVTTSETNRDY